MKSLHHKALLITPLLLLPLLAVPFVYAQELDSPNYTITDGQIDSGGNATDSTSYSNLVSTGNPTADERLDSPTYRMGTGFPNGIQTNIPQITCFETNTNSGNSSCLKGHTDRLQGICGQPGCYDKAKLEINDHDNPYDTLYLVRLVVGSTTYYLQSDHTISTTFDINDFLTQCDLEGYDSDHPTCDTGEADEDTSLQEANILGLSASTTYTASVTALQGDFTGSGYSPTANATTEAVQIVFDLDVATTNTESSAPHSLDLGILTSSATNTAAKSIWVDIGTNNTNGVNIYVADDFNGLFDSVSSVTIPSETEDLDAGGNTNGGYGLKTISVTQTALGPLKNSGTIYNTAGANQVGRLQSGTNNLILFTNTTGSVGQITAGRAEVRVKARLGTTSPLAGAYNDEITFTATLVP